MGGRRSAERGVSEVLGYVLSVAIVGMVMLGVVVSSSSYFEQRDRVATGTELEEQGQQVSRTIGIVDRLVRKSDSSGEIGRSVDLPTTIGEERYRITVINRTRAGTGLARCDRSCLVLSTNEVTRRVYVASVTGLRSGTVAGQPLYVVRPSDSSAIELRVQQ